MSRIMTAVTHEQRSLLMEHHWPRLLLQCNEWDEVNKQQKTSCFSQNNLWPLAYVLEYENERLSAAVSAGNEVNVECTRKMI